MVRESFHWSVSARVLRDLAARAEFRLDRKLRYFDSETQRVQPPLVFPIGASCFSLSRYVESLPEAPGRQVVLLMQAGAVSLGLFDAGEPISTKSFRRYVVRGSGRAQPKHLASKGKSRYGSRLRLQNARRLLEEVNERLVEWHVERPPEQIYYNGSTRLWADLFTVKPAPPLERDEAPIRIPLDLPRPTTEVLLRAYKSLSYGWIEDLTGDAQR